jgi:hypothetical protein
MKMVRSDLASSGVVFTLDTESGFRDAVYMTGAWGLGENVVQGKVDPDAFYVHKPTFRLGYRAAASRALGGKQMRLVYAFEGSRATTRNLTTPWGSAPALLPRRCGGFCSWPVTLRIASDPLVPAVRWCSAVSSVLAFAFDNAGLERGDR